MGYLQDPRVLFAAERTALAWNRSSLALMAFGFAIERLGLYLQLVADPRTSAYEQSFSAWIGIAFVALGSIAALLSGWQYHLATWLNVLVALLGSALLIYLL